MQVTDIIRTRKHNQSSLQIAANSIIENNGMHRPSVGVSGQFDNNLGLGKQQPLQHYHTEGDTYSQSVDDSGKLLSDIVVDKNTDDFKSEMKKGNNNIMVAVRCRPLSIKEKQKQSQKSVKILDEKIIILSDISAARPEEAFRKERPKEKTYAFDYAFDETQDQQYIFDRTTKFLIEGIMQGYNASVFAYGATGAGKTYTMLGTEDCPGIMMLSIDELFRSIDSYTSERDYKLKVSYVEVYNENIRDLLTERDEYLDLREDQVKGVCVAGVTDIMTTNVDEINKYIRQGNKNRTKERTDANETSSRSHAVLQITVEHKDKAHGISAEINIAKLSLIDLAGSERASNTNNRGIRLLEGANINKSLLALGNCINALCELTKSGNSNKQMHIPYRDSKLTRLLKDSLGGNCRTVMITNISPAFTAYEDTLNTLKYADRAKQIKTVVKRNVLNVEFHISNYTKIITSLRDEITSLRTQLAQNSGQPTISSKLNNTPQLINGSVHKNSQSIQAQNKLKAMKIEMNLQFEKEITIKKDIYEVDMKNEDLAFKLFSKQMFITKNKNKGPANQPIEQEVQRLKAEISQNDNQKLQLNRHLTELENHRNKMLEEYQQEMIQYEIDAIDVLYNKHLLDIKQIDIKRKENRAEFHIKQRDNYIQHLKEQLAIRDRIIKDRLGLSITNFMPGGQNPVEGGVEILSLQDIDRISNDLILPSLNMTKSSSFVPQLQVYKHNILSHADIQENPYSYEFGSNINTSPHQRNMQHGTNIHNNKHRSVDINKRHSDPNNYNRVNAINEQNQYTNQLQLSNQTNSTSSNNKQSYQIPRRPPGSTLNSQAQQQSSNANLLDKKAYKPSKDLHYESDNQNGNNISFQSHRNNSNSRLINSNINSYGTQQQNTLIQSQQTQQNIPPGTSGGESTGSNQQKSFVNEMQKQKQKFALLNKNQVQEPADVFTTKGRGIPKNPANFNQKLSLLKKRVVSNEQDDNSSISFQSSRNQTQAQPQVHPRIGAGSHIMQNNGNQIANIKTRKVVEQSNTNHNNSTTNIGQRSVNNSLQAMVGDNL